MAKSKKKPTARKTPVGNRDIQNDQAVNRGQAASKPVAPDPLFAGHSLNDRIGLHLEAIEKAVAGICAELRHGIPACKLHPEKTGLVCTPSKHASGDESILSFAQQCVLDVIDAIPHRGPEIAHRAGYTYDAVRHHLSLLRKLGLIEHDNRGYFRI